MPTATVRRSGFRLPVFRLPGFCRPDFPRPGRLFIASGLLCAAVLTPGLARADTAYIIDEIVVPLRETPCSSCRVIRQGMRSGAAVKVLETADGWTRVEVAEGIAGWLPSRYLTPEPIAREQLSALREEVQRLQAENLRLAQDPAATTDGAAVAASMTPGGDPLATGDAADASDLYAQNQALLTHNKILQSEIDVLHATKEELQSNDIQRWFIFGGLLVALGAFLGMVLPLLKPKRRGYSEWN